jgi:hypothetical protein
MPPIRIKKDIHQGVLTGNGVICRCRVELVTKTTAGHPPVRIIDVWIEKKPPEGDYKIFVNGTILQVRFSRGAWLEAVA